MLLPKVRQDHQFKLLISQVRELRSKMSICPSAAKGVNISELLKEIINKDAYKKDYAEITAYFQNHPVKYENAIEAIKKIAESGIFDE